MQSRGGSAVVGDLSVSGDVKAFKINGWAYQDYTMTMPAAGGSTTMAHGLTHANIRNFEATCLSSDNEMVPRGYIYVNGGRGAHYDLYANATNLTLIADATIAPAWVGRPVYIRVWYLA